MLHALPALLQELETRLIQGEDPEPLLATVRWSEVVGWPQDAAAALTLKLRVLALQELIQGLQAPLRVTLNAFSEGGAYQAKGGMALPRVLSAGFQEEV